MQPPTPDPLRYLPAPDPVQLGLPVQGNEPQHHERHVQLYPGVYNGGITISQGAKRHACTPTPTARRAFTFCRAAV